MKKKNIAVYLQHYLSPSMTFIYRQINERSIEFNYYVYVSRRLENESKFPYENIKYLPTSRISRNRIIKRMFNLEIKNSINPKLSSKNFDSLGSQIKKANISLIHAHFGPSAIEILPIAEKMRIPLVVSLHGYDGSILLKHDKYLQNLIELSKYCTFITPSIFMKKNILKFLGNSKIEVIHYGIPMSFYQYIKRELPKEKIEKKKQIKFLQVSNLVPKKGHIYSLRAFKKFNDYYKNSIFTIGGSGPLLEHLKEESKSLRIEDNVRFLGLVDQAQGKQLMNDTDVFLHHSVTDERGDQEGIPNVIMEAMATGLPVISSYHAGIPELIIDGQNGFLVQEKNIDQYFQKMKEILTVNEDMGCLAKKTIFDKFNLDFQNEKLDLLYKKVMNVS